MKDKAQVSVELIILLAVVFIIFLSIFSLVPDRNTHASQQVIELSAKSMADKLARTINAVYLAGNGAIVQLPLSATLSEGTPYNITVYPADYFLEVRWDGVDQRHYSVGLITGNVTGNITGRSGKIILQQINGGVRLT